MEKIYLKDMLSLFWSARRLMLISAAICLFIACVALIVIRPVYSATVILVPTSANQYAIQPGGLGSSSGASLAGQLLGIGGADKASQQLDQFLELFKSPYVANLTDKQYHLLPHIFAGQWDERNARWKTPTGLMAFIKKALRPVFNLPAWTPPDAYTLADNISARLSIDHSVQTGILRLSITDADPTYAAFLLNAFYETSDGLLRQKAKARSDEHIRYIQSQLASVSYAENRQSLTTLLTAELAQQLLINSHAPFVLEKLEPISISPKPVSPKPFLFVIGAILAGCVIGFFLSLFGARLNQSF